MLATMTGAQLLCMGGEAELSFIALPELPILIEEMTAGKITDNIPYVNLIPSGPCMILTAEAMGVPIPCTPIPVSPWIAGNPTILIGGVPILDNLSVLPCAFGGVITILFPANTSVNLG